VPQSPERMDKTITKTVRLDYLLHLPGPSREGRGRTWPLILFLHGAGERGSDLNLVRKHGIPKIAESARDLPFVTVSPQCPTDSVWDDQVDALLALLDEVSAAHPVDPDRVYLTGMSLGGYGTWNLAALHPDRFAAIAPICGGAISMRGFPDRVCSLRQVPVWAFHGALDPSTSLGAWWKRCRHTAGTPYSPSIRIWPMIRGLAPMRIPTYTAGF
jgi:predicted peptidase